MILTLLFLLLLYLCHDAVGACITLLGRIKWSIYVCGRIVIHDCDRVAVRCCHDTYYREKGTVIACNCKRKTM